MTFQWDVLLLESGILGHIPYEWISGSRLALPLVGLPLSVSGGSRQAAIRRPDMAQPYALEYHFWTQPLPTPLAGMPRSCRAGSLSLEQRLP